MVWSYWFWFLNTSSCFFLELFVSGFHKIFSTSIISYFELYANFISLPFGFSCVVKNFENQHHPTPNTTNILLVV
ncbi:hypothetical protein QR98_0093360 [Sarcoptes scabiei]|uniref:Uncharacterized protein n=1 Tax=Sarcoptes scabiei TaxID=52283 RepID=A0A132AIM6_SARSC|nr:hypothetical protein QR98_0093360 [Sarcoptes scabiei]